MSVVTEPSGATWKVSSYTAPYDTTLGLKDGEVGGEVEQLSLAPPPRHVQELQPMFVELIDMVSAVMKPQFTLPLLQEAYSPLPLPVGVGA